MKDTLRVVVFAEGLTESKSACDAAIDRRGLNFTTFYPGGLYGVCSFFISMDSTRPHEFKEKRRVAIYSGIKMIWEGAIDGVVYTSLTNQEGLMVFCTGYWGALLKRRRWDKVWCDTRITEVKWPLYTAAATQEDKFNLDRYNRLKITPAESSFAQYDDLTVHYTMPTGQTIALITGNYEMHEGTQAWITEVYDETGGSSLFRATSSGTSTFSGTPDTGCQTVQFKFYADATQTYDYDMKYYGQVTNVKVYSEAVTPTMTSIVQSIRNHITDLAIDESLISTNSQVLEPAYMEGETIAEYLSKLAAFGDTSLNSWAAGVDVSQKSLATDYKPMLYFEQQPVITDYDYVIRVSDTEGGCQIEMAYDEIVNWIILEYTDINGDRVRVTPDDDATLKDDTSIDQFGQRDGLLRLGSAGVTEAKIYAARYLEWFKYARPRLGRPIVMKGMIRTKSHGHVPISQVRAGKRILVENYLQEIGGSTLIFLITATSYDEDTGRLTITAGTPDPLETLAARRRGI